MADIHGLFESPRLLIQRGREHIQDLAARQQAFTDSAPCTQVINTDPKTGEYVHKIRLTQKLPSILRTIVKDASGNLRDALDHAVYASAVALTDVDNPNDTGFPFARDAAGVKGELAGKRLKGNPPEIRPLLASFEPHEAGNRLLCALNRIRNPNTHRVLVPVGTAGMSPSIGIRQIANATAIAYSRWDSTKNEVEYLRVLGDGVFNYQIAVSFNVVFGDVDFVAGEPAVPALYAILSEVERIVSAIEAETARIIESRT